MTLISFSRELYSLETLDTRFGASSRTPLKVDDSEPRKPAGKDVRESTDLPQGATTSKWNTPEFYFYGLVVLACVPQMYWAVVQISQPSSPNYDKYEHLLSPGWLFGRKVDNSDSQYSGFRDNIPALAALVLIHPALRKLYERIAGQSTTSSVNGSGKQELSTHLAEQRRNIRIRFDLVSAVIFIAALYGISAIKILLIVYINFKIATALPRNTVPAATWIFNVTILFANELSQGYPFAKIASFLALSEQAVKYGQFLDSYGGLMPRWEVLFKITILRLISFNMDYYWSFDRSRSSSPVERKKNQVDPSSPSEKDRIANPAPSGCYTSLSTYLAYALYPPLYIAGPILTFNDYISQCTYPSSSVTTRRTVMYGIRFLAILFCMEFLQHTIYVVAIAQASPDWSTYTPFQLAMLSYFNLHIIWLKLLIPWRFFRLWALVDGIDPPENMVRCMSDNYSTLAFWRSWHRSFNRFTIRYIFIPMGGSGRGTSIPRTIFNMIIVFMFVALWHDINLRLLMWGWLIVLFVLPEVLASLAFPASKWKNRPTAYRMICGVGAVANVLMMMSANLVGFAVGLDGLMAIVHGIAGSWEGLLFMLTAMGALFVGVQVMFEHREAEKRKGVNMKC